jgi:hypothetical protein
MLHYLNTFFFVSKYSDSLPRLERGYFDAGPMLVKVAPAASVTDAQVTVDLWTNRASSTYAACDKASASSMCPSTTTYQFFHTVL